MEEEVVAVEVEVDSVEENKVHSVEVTEELEEVPILQLTGD